VGSLCAEKLSANVTLLKKKNRVDCEMLAKMPRARIPAFYVYSAVGKNLAICTVSSEFGD
jgi:hypothetical protein